ncbi:CLAVATA3/ESR (CLE)-related protein 25 [Argentina anserina]|uniref:CLAVATA3/ESR (CLE)-related protein 25 n=1 Tax=Argentina anserina TaxID=57926 RepID=UPI002176228F|nr:CLAVATA3/ESR (CLE)-related protein 25 [Potentilla anserina]
MESLGRSKVLRVLFGLLLLLGVFWFFSTAILVNHTTGPTVTVSSSRIFKHWKLNGRDKKHAVVWDSSTFIYVSKRRVPNGPDPIHNRRAVKTRQPAGRA